MRNHSSAEAISLAYLAVVGSLAVTVTIGCSHKRDVIAQAEKRDTEKPSIR